MFIVAGVLAVVGLVLIGLTWWMQRQGRALDSLGCITLAAIAFLARSLIMLWIDDGNEVWYVVLTVFWIGALVYFLLKFGAEADRQKSNHHHPEGES
jgi:hypothetical protein